MASNLPLPPQLYGIWRPGLGWWKLSDGKGHTVVYADLRRSVVAHYARWVGDGAYVMPVDKSLDTGVDLLIQAEKSHVDFRLREWRKKTWDTLMKLWRNRAN